MSLVAHTFQILGQAANIVADKAIAKWLGINTAPQHSHKSADASNPTRSAEVKSLHQPQEPYSFVYGTF